MMATSVAAWEARAEYDMGVMIDRYLREHPSPGHSEMTLRLQSCAKDFREAGEFKLRILEVRRLCVAPTIEGSK
jgi:hypothetical protein